MRDPSGAQAATSESCTLWSVRYPGASGAWPTTPALQVDHADCRVARIEDVLAAGRPRDRFNPGRERMGFTANQEHFLIRHCLAPTLGRRHLPRIGPIGRNGVERHLGAVGLRERDPLPIRRPRRTTHGVRQPQRLGRADRMRVDVRHLAEVPGIPDVLAVRRPLRRRRDELATPPVPSTCRSEPSGAMVWSRGITRLSR